MMNPKMPLPMRYLVTAICCLWLAGCGGPDEGPEAQLRAWVAQGKAFAEEKNRRGLVNMISPAYTDSRGNERDDIDKLLIGYFFRTHSVGLITAIDELEVYGDDAGEILLTVGMAGTNDGTFGFSADAYQFEMELEQQGGEWLLTSARWGELGDDLR